MAGRADAVPGGGLGVVDDAGADAAIEERHPLLGDPLVVERHRQAGRVGSVVGDGHEVTGDPLADLDERALLLDRQGAEPEVAEHVHQVDDGVFLEDDRVVAGLERPGVDGRASLGCRLPAQCRGIDRRRVDGRRLGIAGAAIGAHGDRDELRRRPLAGRLDAARVGDRHALRRRGERPVRGDAGLVGRGDHRPGALGSSFRGRGGSGVGEGRRQLADEPSRLREPRPVLELLDIAGDRAGTFDEASDAVVVGPTRRRDAHPLADDEAEIAGRARLGDVLVDLAVGEAGQLGVVGGDQCLGLGRAGRDGQRDGPPGDRQPLRGAVAAQLSTPTWTFRKRAPETAWPIWPTWPGSPLPQFGVPSIR